VQTLGVILTAVDEPLARAWTQFCGEFPFVRVHAGSIFDVECDALVSPANSFGFMDGGIDALYTHRFGHGVQERLQRAIQDHHGGELLVGDAEIVETFEPTLPFVIAAPTMRVPMVLRETVNPYLAARAVFRLIAERTFRAGAFAGMPVADVVRRVAIPGLGTGVGAVGPNTCARQVAQAIRDVLIERPTFPATWAEASERHQLLYTDRPRNLQMD
jgi:O-acetyl-ADP-ribose deacetylase (regulator of RNase III)